MPDQSYQDAIDRALDPLLRECTEAVRTGACTCADDDLCPTHQRFMDACERAAGEAPHA